MVHDHDHKNHKEPEHILVTSDSYDYLWQMPNELWHFLDCQSSHSKWDKMRMESPKPGQQIVHGQELLNVAKQGKQQSGYHLKTNSAAAPLMAIAIISGLAPCRFLCHVLQEQIQWRGRLAPLWLSIDCHSFGKILDYLRELSEVHGLRLLGRP